ncbi:MAG: transcription antitermination factor NusB [Candidatus Latescibacteria bacterium]|nr:transcription antitermination factor NusB [Candidatus Latescibacterota bacterium]
MDAPDLEIEEDHPPPNSRRGARQLALQALYWTRSSPGSPDAALEEWSRQYELSDDVRAFAGQLVRRVDEKGDELDALIAATADHWSSDRMARIDVLILSLALAEILYFEDIPVRVSIDEAIELARLFSTEQSYAFINGILDAVVRQKKLPV